MSPFRIAAPVVRAAVALALACGASMAIAQSPGPDEPVDDRPVAPEGPPAQPEPAPVPAPAAVSSPAPAAASAPVAAPVPASAATPVFAPVAPSAPTSGPLPAAAEPSPASSPSAASVPAVSTTTITTTTTTITLPPAVASGVVPVPAPARPRPAPAPVPPLQPQAAPAPAPAAQAPSGMLLGGAQLVRDARDAWVRRDRQRLAQLRDQAVAMRLSLAPWVDYWELTLRLGEVNVDEVQAFYARWPGTYVEDRLRNDWLLELGRRRDWANFVRDFPRFRMNDDREVTCYELLAEHLAGKDVRDAARTAWLAQRDADDGCQLLAQTLLDDRSFSEDDVWRRLRQAAEYGRARAARAAAQMLGKPVAKDIAELWDNPARFLTRHGGLDTPRRSRLVALALARMAASDAGAAALQMNERWESGIDRDLAAWVWAIIAKQGAQSLLPDAVDWADRAWAARGRASGGDHIEWGDDALDWQARAAIRVATGPEAAHRWRDALRAMDAMSPADRAAPAWVYWRAKARLATARNTPEGEVERTEARAALAQLAGTLDFYGLLAAEDLGTPAVLPPRPAPLTAAERTGARALPGLQRARALADLDMRDEGRREWNFTLRGMDDRQLLAAAQWACEATDWQLCINTSERTKGEIDVQQRYPMPYRRDIDGAARTAGLETAFVLGLIRQETRFMPQLRSHVGATGLMQLMPSTAKWTARKAGLPPVDDLADPQANLRLGTAYLRLVMDAFGESAPMAAAAYNAGPARPRRWRDGLMLDPVVWTENVPFFETRDYVKKVMTNAAVYAALETGHAPELRPRLGPRIGPRDAEQPSADIP